MCVVIIFFFCLAKNLAEINAFIKFLHFFLLLKPPSMRKYQNSLGDSDRRYIFFNIKPVITGCLLSTLSYCQGMKFFFEVVIYIFVIISILPLCSIKNQKICYKTHIVVIVVINEQPSQQILKKWPNHELDTLYSFKNERGNTSPQSSYDFFKMVKRRDFPIQLSGNFAKYLTIILFFYTFCYLKNIHILCKKKHIFCMT